MNWHRALLALPLLGLACGKVTSLGSEKGGGNAGQGGTAVDGGAGAGSGGVAGTGAGGSGGSSAATSTCDVSPAPPIANPTPEQVERAKLIHDFCTNVVQQCGDLPFAFGGHASGECSPSELVLGCEQDTLESYLVSHSGCNGEWTNWMLCGATATYDTLQKCFNIDDAGLPCEKEKLALTECSHASGPWKSVAGAYTTCNYGPTIMGPCELICIAGENYFDIICAANPGLPLLCSCTVNGNFINQDFGSLGGNFYASDCADAAKRAADGKCTNRLECCFQYTDGGKDVCLCGSDPNLLGQPSCQGLADFTGGKVVDICPQYLPKDGTCWPPPCE